MYSTQIILFFTFRHDWNYNINIIDRGIIPVGNQNINEINTQQRQGKKRRESIGTEKCYDVVFKAFLFKVKTIEHSLIIRTTIAVKYNIMQNFKLLAFCKQYLYATSSLSPVIFYPL